MADRMTLDWRPVEQQFQRHITAFLARVERNVDQVVLDFAIRALDRIKTEWPVDTGVSRAAWWGPHRLGVAQYQIGNPTPYAITIEFGLYRGVGPKTEALGAVNLGNGLWMVASGIFSTQAHAPVRRALAAVTEAFQRELAGAVRQSWRA